MHKKTFFFFITAFKLSSMAKSLHTAIERFKKHTEDMFHHMKHSTFYSVVCAQLVLNQLSK